MASNPPPTIPQCRSNLELAFWEFENHHGLEPVLAHLQSILENCAEAYVHEIAEPIMLARDQLGLAVDRYAYLMKGPKK